MRPEAGTGVPVQGFQLLDEFKALSAGSDVWLIANPARSHWARRIDWYLNFQLMRGTSHQSPAIADGIKNILKNEDLEEVWPLPSPPLPPGAPLMIESRRLLPNSSTIMVPLEDDVSQWTKTCHDIWSRLNRPQARIFLPKDASVEAFKSAWVRLSSEQNEQNEHSLASNSIKPNGDKGSSRQPSPTIEVVTEEAATS